MKAHSVRVMVASENPATRTVLRRIVETEGQAVIVGEAENGARALNLARRLRPDVVIIDSHLPHVVGLDDVPLSRIGGLDIAQSISQEIPAMRVVLLNNLSGDVLSRSGWRPEDSALLCRESSDTCVPFSVGELSASVGSLIFANIETKQEAIPYQKISLGDKLVLAGVLGGVAGWLMILTMFLATIGVFLVGAGVLTALAGMGGKLLSRNVKPSRIPSR